jgi:TetR/AcrR family acrAB operon transcriptional repressor
MATRNALIDAAERLFDSQVPRTSLQDIAQAAGATRGAIYWHFKDKADLFNAMMERATAHLDDMAQQTPTPRPRPTCSAMWTAWSVLGRIAEDEALSRVLRIATYRIE